jgi:ubiquinone/menaquinone biosynthesis C-methylase UbiE
MQKLKLDMSFENVNNDWEKLAQKDAMWAILTNQNKTGNKWSVSEFFQCGINEIEILFNYLKQNNISVADYDKALDFGCGVGRLARALSSKFKQVTGVDVSTTMINKAKELNNDRSNQLDFVVNASAVLPFDNNSFSFIYSTIVLQHIPYPQQVGYIVEFCRVLKPGGLLVFQIPTADIRKISLVQKIKNIIKIREKLTKLGLDNFYHMQMNPISEKEINTIIHQNNCMILHATYTNHTDPNFGGNLIFMNKQDSVDYESGLFVVSKK